MRFANATHEIVAAEERQKYIAARWGRDIERHREEQVASDKGCGTRLTHALPGAVCSAAAQSQPLRRNSRYSPEHSTAITPSIMG